MDKQKIHNSLINKSQETFVRSGGNGGQNVNKVNTKVHLVLPVKEIDGLTDSERERLRVRLYPILNRDDCLYIDCDEERHQDKNRKTALLRLENKIIQALSVAKKRYKTQPTKASKERNLRFKKIRSAIKKNRSKIL